MAMASPSSRFRWRAYAPLALLRVLAAVFSLAMVHPDEFFQSQEVMARHVLDEQDPTLAEQLHVPWEFSLPSPNRSVLFPYVTVRLYVYAWCVYLMELLGCLLGISSQGFLTSSCNCSACR
jgi:hypothetical protein